LDGTPYIDKEEIAKELEKLQEPVYFLDFETMNWAVPRYRQSSPYNQIPFQWSLHILSGGELEHREFLCDTSEDPRPDFVQGLVENIGDSGLIVVYHKSFEGGILKRLADIFPDQEDRLRNFTDRLWDLEKIFLNHYTDPGFLGSTSIKKVLPVIVPSLNYDELEIGEGDSAQASWVRMIGCEGEEKEELRKALLTYCEMDTRAMVEIYRKLCTIIDQEGSRNAG
jgi:hypothetical protein